MKLGQAEKSQNKNMKIPMPKQQRNPINRENPGRQKHGPKLGQTIQKWPEIRSDRPRNGPNLGQTVGKFAEMPIGGNFAENDARAIGKSSEPPSPDRPKNWPMLGQRIKKVAGIRSDPRKWQMLGQTLGKKKPRPEKGHLSEASPN